MRMVPDGSTKGAALVAGVVAVPATALPLNVGIVVAGVCGIGAGVVISHREGDT